MATLVIEHSDTTGSDRLGEILRDHGHPLKVVQVHRGEALPPDLDDIDSIVACGGPQSPLDDNLPWIDQEIELLRMAHETDRSIVGLCLGCQLLARALGGEVSPLENGIEWGWHEVSLTPVGREDPVYSGIAWKSMQLHAHRFHVSQPPAGARVLARSEITPVQAWASGLRTYGFQYHPESYRSTIEAWMAQDPQDVQEVGLTPDEVRQRTDEHFPAFERLAERLFRQVALILMPVDRRFAGLAKDLYH